MTISYPIRFLLAILGAVISASFPSLSEAQQTCNTTLECAQKAVAAAQGAESAASALNSDMAQLKTSVQKLGTGICTTTAAQNKFDTTKSFDCPTGYYVAGIVFSHPGGENLTYQESVALHCCPIH